MFSFVVWLLFCSYVIEIAVPFLAFAPVRGLRVFVYCSEVRDQPAYFKCGFVSLISIFFFLPSGRGNLASFFRTVHGRSFEKMHTIVLF